MPLATVTAQSVARASQGLDGLTTERPVDLVAEVPDVDLDDVRVSVEVNVPHRVQDLTLGDDVALVACEEREQGELPGRQLQLDLPPPGTPCRRVQAQVPGLELRGPLPGAPTSDCAEPRNEH